MNPTLGNLLSYCARKLLATRGLRICCLVTVLAGAALSSKAATLFEEPNQILLEPIALGGRPLPGEAIDFRFEDLIGWPYMNGPGFHLNNSGKISFVGQTARSLTRFQGVWVGDSDELIRVARENEQAPSLPDGVNFWLPFKTPIVDDHGDVTFFGLMRDGVGGITLANRNGIWSGPPEAPSLVLQTGVPTAGVPGGVLTEFFDLNVGPTGHFLFEGLLQVGSDDVDATNSRAVFSHHQGALSVVARDGFPAPGAPGRVFDLSMSGSDALRSFYDVTDDDEVILLAQLDDGFRGIWSGIGETQQPIVLEGGAVPGVHGAVFAEKSLRNNQITVSRNGHLSFTARMEEGLGGVTSENWHALWAGPHDNLQQPIVRQGDQASGLQSGIKHNLILRHTINDSGLTSVLGTLTGPGVSSENDRAIWVGTSGDINLVMREGAPIPGNDPNLVFGDLGSSSAPPIINNAGWLLIHADIRDSSTGIEREALWSYADGSGLQLLAVEDTVLEINRRDIRTIDRFAATLNDQGKVAMRLTFKDGSFGIFSTTIPEPASLLITCMATTLFLLIRTRPYV